VAGVALSIWERLAERKAPAERPDAEAAAPSDGGDRRSIWETLQDRINISLYRPARSPHTVLSPLTSRRGQPYFILSNRNQYTYLRLGPEEHYLWSLMDGTRSVKELVIEYFSRFGVLAFGLVGQLVVHLRASRMLADGPVNVFHLLMQKLERGRWRHIPRLVWEVAAGRRALTIRKVDGVITWLYRHGGWILYTRPMQILYLVICGVGGWLFFKHATSGQIEIFRVGGSYAKGFLLLFGLNYFSIAIHELAHALTCKHYGARVNAAGALLFFGVPAYYVDTTDIWTRPARARIATSWAGPYSGFILAGLFSIFVEFWPDSPFAPFLHRLAFIWIYILIFNLIPLLDLDGYFMFIDWVDIPMLRQKALAFLRRDLWGKIRRWESLARQEILLTAYGLTTIAFMTFLIYLSVKYWGKRLTFLQELWAGGLGSRIVLFLLLPALTLPLLTPLITRAVLLGRAATGWARTVWRRPRRWTLREREALLRRVRFLSPLPEDVLPQVVSRVERMTFRPGATIIREGETGDRFYVIESGTAEVFVGDETQPRRVLTTGEYFGEIALLQRIPRTATVRAASRLIVLSLRKGSFDRLLAPAVAASGQIDEAIYALDQLRGFSIFAGLSSRELDELAHRLVRERFDPGTIVVKEGDPGDAFYLIDSGQAEAIATGQRVRTLGRGNYFGEIALLLDVPRTATVRALTPLEVFKLNRVDFDALLGTVLGHVGDALETVARERLGVSAGTLR